METMLSGGTVPTKQPQGEWIDAEPPKEGSRIHFKDEHLQETVNVPREPHPRFPNMTEPADEITMKDLPGYMNAKLGNAIAEGRLHSTLAHFEKVVGAEDLIGDGGMEKLKDLTRRAHEHRFDPEITRRIGAEAREFVSQWQIAKIK